MTASAIDTDSGLLRAVVVDDTSDIRLLLRMALEKDGEIKVVAEAANGREGIEAASAWHPDLVLLDLAMPVMDGLEALPSIRHACPGATIVVLSGFDAATLAEPALAAGADGYVQKGLSVDEIVARVLELAARNASPAATAPRPRFDRERVGTTAPAPPPTVL